MSKDLTLEDMSEPKIEELDVVLLKDGRRATIVEKLSETDFLVDVGSSPEDWDTIFISLDNIEGILWQYKNSEGGHQIGLEDILRPL